MEEYKKVTISFTKDQLEKLDEILKHEQGYTRSSLVREAVDNYIGYRVQKESVSYLSPIISQNIKLVLGRFEENLSEMLFKLAVEVSKSNILSARNSELNDYALNYINAVSEQLVAEHNGVLDLEKARDFIEVEKLPDTKKYNLTSSKQDDLILSVVKHFPQSKKFLEYED